MRRIAALFMLLVCVCSCSSTRENEPVDAAPYTCIPPARPTAPTATQKRIAVIGDSFTGGSPQGGTGERRWTAVATSLLQADGLDVVMKVDAERGAGYFAKGKRTGQVFRDKIPATVTSGDSVVVVFGSINDASATAGQMARATCDTMRDAEIAAPASHLVIVGPSEGTAKPPEPLLSTRDVVRTRAAELGATFIDPIADKWFVDRPDLIGADGLHPTDAGHEYMAQKIAPVIAELLGRTPTK